MLAINYAATISATTFRGLTYTDGTTIVMKYIDGNSQTSYSLVGDDFSGIVYNNGISSTITILKAGTYEINSAGTISTKTYNANDTFVLSNVQFSIRKIK